MSQAEDYIPLKEAAKHAGVTTERIRELVQPRQTHPLPTYLDTPLRGFQDDQRRWQIHCEDLLGRVIPAMNGRGQVTNPDPIRNRVSGDPPLEITIERLACAYVESYGGIVAKGDPRSCIGIPDRIFLMPGGITVLTEFKRPGRGRLSPVQKHRHEALQRNNHNVWVVDDIDRFRDMIDGLMAGVRRR